MDIQRPSAPAAPPQPPRPAVLPNTQPQPTQLSRPATMEYTRPRPNSPVNPNGGPVRDIPSGINQTNQSETPKPKKSKKGLVIGIILFFIVMTVGGFVAYYFLVLNVAEEVVTQPQTTQTEAPAEELTPQIEATPEGVDNATNAIDQSLNSLNDDADFPADQLTDTSLGL